MKGTQTFPYLFNCILYPKRNYSPNKISDGNIDEIVMFILGFYVLLLFGFTFVALFNLVYDEVVSL